MQDALGSPIVVQNRSTWQGARVHDRPYLLQFLVNVTRKQGFGHYRARVEIQGVSPSGGEYFEDVASRDHANGDTVAIAHHDERRIPIL
jgi:hypothetical protein